MKTPRSHSLIEALDEPALIVESLTVALANEPARLLFGRAIEGNDVRLAIRHPDALDRILSAQSGDVEITGIGELGRSWTLSVRELSDGALFVRLFDASAAAAADKFRTDFVANASHELRTPLSTILGYAEPLSDDPKMDDADRTTLAAIIRTEAKRMVRIIDDLMSLSRIEADRFVSPDEQVSIPNVLDMALAHAGRVIGADKCQIEVDIQDGLPRIAGDSSQLCQLLDNLLSNALRYGCPPGKSTVRVAVRKEGGSVLISVADEGPGIAKKHIPHLTKRFYRVDDSRNRDSGGTGLGLALVKHIVERHRGRLTIDSEEGKGTRVLVKLPVTA